MRTSSARTHLRNVAIGALIAAIVAVPRPGAGQQIVLDIANLAQNIVTAVQTTLEIVQQVEQLANEATMIVNQVQQIQHLVEMIRNMDINTLTGGGAAWGDVQMLTGAIATALEVGMSLPYTLSGLDGQFQQRFPTYTPPIDWNAEYEQWTHTVMDTLRGTLASVGVNLDDASSVQAALQRLRSGHSSTQGRLEALMLANELASLQIEELAKLRQLMAAQVNAQNTFLAARETKESAGEAGVDRWIAAGAHEVPLSAPDPGLAAVPRP